MRYSDLKERSSFKFKVDAGCQVMWVALMLFFSLQGVDVVINASSLDDIDPSAIGQRLTNGTVPVASPVLGRLRVKDEENAEHVVSDRWQKDWGV